MLEIGRTSQPFPTKPRRQTEQSLLQGLQISQVFPQARAEFNSNIFLINKALGRGVGVGLCD